MNQFLNQLRIQVEKQAGGAGGGGGKRPPVLPSAATLGWTGAMVVGGGLLYVVNQSLFNGKGGRPNECSYCFEYISV